MTMMGFHSLPGGPAASDPTQIFDEGARAASEMLSWRLGELRRPQPSSHDPGAAVRALMLRDSVDLACRDAAAITGFVERGANSTYGLTQNTRRKQIIPAVPSIVALKKIALDTVTALDAACVPWTQEDASNDNFRPILDGRRLEAFMSGRPSLLGVNSAQVQLGRLLVAIDGLESRWGSFHVWSKKPERATISLLGRALLNREKDAEEFLEEVICERGSLPRYVPETSEEARGFLAMKATIAAILFNDEGDPYGNTTALKP